MILFILTSDAQNIIQFKINLPTIILSMPNELKLFYERIIQNKNKINHLLDQFFGLLVIP